MRFPSVSFLFCALCLASPLFAQWTHRYPKVEGYRHHVYLEGYELPIAAAGPTDPALSPDGSRLVLASRGFLWILELKSGVARRLTAGPDLDSRPSWSPDGLSIAFVRDDSEDTDIYQVELSSGVTTALVETPALDLDPAFSRDGRTLFYASSVSGDIDLWRLELESGVRRRLTSEVGLELRPLPAKDGNRLVYLAKSRGGPDRLSVLDLRDNRRQVLRTESIASVARPAMSPTGDHIVVNWPGPTDWDLWLVDLSASDRDWIRLTRGGRLPLSPAFSSDGDFVYFVEADARQSFSLYRVPVRGGAAEAVPVNAWDWGVPTGRLLVKTQVGRESVPVAARLSVVDDLGHAAFPDSGQTRFDPWSGKIYSYSSGIASYELPAGDVRIQAARGFTAPALSVERRISPGGVTEVDLPFQPIWEPGEEGWYSGDHHFHLNYGGPYRLAPEDLGPLLSGEDLDVATPLVANLHHRFTDLEWWNWRSPGGPPLIAFGQEVRSHLLGHLGLVGIASPFWPWYWGPEYPVYDEDDRPNVDALAHARAQGGVSAYVHPVALRDPFESDEGREGIPLSSIADAVLGDVDSLEIAGLWLDPLGTSALWYRLLNVGATIVPSAGTDAFPNYYRSMALGATRIYVRVSGPLNLQSYLHAYRQGRSFVTNGPLLSFTVDGQGPGDVLTRRGEGEVVWNLTIASPVAVDTVELIVNGEVVDEQKGLTTPGIKTFEGKVSLPGGGFIALRAHGGAVAWPLMDAHPFAHTAPLWIQSRGSTETRAATSASRELLAALAIAEKRLREAYRGVEIPRLEARLLQAKNKLLDLSVDRR